jgi:calpain-15
VRNWDEVRIKGKFVKVQDIEDANIEVVMSKWYYSLDLYEKTNIVIGVHQEDERIKGVSEKRPFLDIGLSVFKRNENSNLDVVQMLHSRVDRQIEIECELPPGQYIILPRTSGLTLRRPTNAN